MSSEHEEPGAAQDARAGDDLVPAQEGQSEQERRNRRLARLRAAAARWDSQPSLLDAAARLRRRLPGDERYGDPLSSAGDEPVNVLARGVSALQPDRPSVVHELGLTGLQLWQSLSEGAGRGRGDQELAILFTDLVGHSKWGLEAGDTAVLGMLREVGGVIEGAIADHDGRIVKRLGDGVMAVFTDGGAAVEAALDGQRALEGVEVEGYRPQMRAGVHCGRPRKLGNDYLGVDVNIAARVGAAAKGGQVLVSDATCQSLDPERLALGRPKRLRASGVPKELRVCTVEAATEQ